MAYWLDAEQLVNILSTNLFRGICGRCVDSDDDLISESSPLSQEWLDVLSRILGYDAKR